MCRVEKVLVGRPQEQKVLGGSTQEQTVLGFHDRKFVEKQSAARVTKVD